MCIFIEKTVIGTSFIKSKSSEEFIFTYLIPFDTGPCTSSLERKKIKFSSVVLRKSLEKRVKAYLKSVSKGLWKFIAFGFLDFGKTNAWLQVKELSFRLDKKTALCSRNFQNVKLRLDFVEIWSFYRHSELTWNHILGNSNSPKMSFLAILEVLNLDFSKSEPLSSPKFTKIQSSESLKLPKMAFLDCWNSPKLDST